MPTVSDVLTALDLTHLSLEGASMDELVALPRAALLNQLKELGVAKMAERQALATACSKIAKGQPFGVPKKKSKPLRDIELAKDVGKDFRSLTSLNSRNLAAELSALPIVGPSELLPWESEATAARRPEAKARLITLYGSFDTASAFADWAATAPSWLEVRAVELPGHGTRRAEGVWALGKRQDPPDASPEALASFVTAERQRCVSDLADALAPLCAATSATAPPPIVALYGFSSGAMLAYLLVVELQRRAAADAVVRLFVCGRGAPHCVHVTEEFWAAMRWADDATAMRTLNKVIGVPLPAAAAAAAQEEVAAVDEAAEQELRETAELWRASIAIAMVHVGDTPIVADPRTTPPFPTAAEDLEKLEYAAGAPKVSACPVVAIGSHMDKVWRWPLPKAWEGVAAAGFRAEQVESAVAHFRLMNHEEVVLAVTAELAGAAIAHARFG